MHHGRCLFIFRHEFLGPGTSLIILIPVPAIGQIHTLRYIQAQRMDVIHKATGFSTLCMILICSVVVVLFADDAFNLRLDSLIAFLFVFAMLLLIASFSFFLHEIFIASHSLPATALHGTRHRQDPHAGGH